MPIKKIRFGTDGWRAVIADDYTFENVRYCAQGWADYLKDQGGEQRGVVIGYDTRFASEDFAAAAAEVFAGNGVPAILCAQAQTTPVVSFGIIDEKAAGGIMITASHNPPTYNGFKVRGDYGGAISPEVIAELEPRIHAAQEAGRANSMPLASAKERGLVRMIDPGANYVAHIGKLVDLESIKASGLNVVHDAMFGAGADWFPRVIGGGKTKITQVDAIRNPWFGGLPPEPITRNLGPLFDAVRREKADVGLATDGDSDRLGVCDEHGEFVDQLRVYSLIVLYLLEVRGFRGPIVKTLSTSSMIDKLGALYGVPVHEVGVGFKFVAPKMLETDAIVGGEESGGYAFRGHLPERDGILAGLFILDLMNKTGKTPAQLVEYLFSKVGPHYYDRLDIHFPASERANIIKRLDETHPEKVAGLAVERENRTDGYKYMLAGGSWSLIRFSGTEPIMRVYTETDSLDRVQAILAAGRQLAGV
jgi:phosphomannomutase